MSKTSELAHLFRAAQSAGRGAGTAGTRRACPRRGLELRAVRRDPARNRGHRPRQPRRRGPDQGRPLPRPQDPGGVRLHLPTLGEEDRGRAPRTARLPPRPRQRRSCSARPAPARPTSRSRSGDPCLPRRPTRPVRDRDRMGRPARRGETPGQPRGRAAPARFIPLLVVDEVGYIPFDPEAANLMFASSAPATNARR